MVCPLCGNRMKKLKRNYRYVESGLDNVILTDIWVYECTCGNEMPELKNIETLHRAIADLIVKKTSPLNGKEVRFIRKELGFRAKDFAGMLGIDPVSVSRWESEASQIGLSNDRLIRMLYIQTIEEQSNKVYKGTVAHLKSIKRVAKEKPMEVRLQAVG